MTTDILDHVEVLLPGGTSAADMLARRGAVPFSPQIVAFISDFGRMLMQDPAVRRFPELVALGFWARGANLKRLQERFDDAYPDTVRLARGVAFHIAPSNVDTIFVYSLLLSLLAGNVNIVRISSRAGEQSNTLMSVLSRALAGAPAEVRDLVAVVRYAHDKHITNALSAACDLRIVWGGDATVSLIRESPLAPGGTELAFPNRYSLAVIDAAACLSVPDPADLARNFVNDSYWFGQLACSSPRSVVWCGSEAEVVAASAWFWPLVEAAAETAGFEWEDAPAVAKLLAVNDAAITFGATVEPTRTNYLSVIRCPCSELGAQPGASGGFFQEYRIDRLADLAKYAARNWQTVVSIGIAPDAWAEFLRAERPAGIDRIVKPGSALNFDVLWDGVDLLASMTRLVSMKQF
jgi:hypothetical protein